MLIAVHHFPPRFQGGAEWRAHRTAKGLQCKGHQVCVLCVESIADGGEGEIASQDTEYNGIPVRRLHFDLSRSPDPFRWSFRNPLIGKQVSNLINEFEPDIFHLIGGYLITGSAIESAQAADVPVVLTLTDFWFLCPRITLVRSDGSLCPSPTDPLACALCLRKQKRRYRLSDQLSVGTVGRALCLVWQKSNDALLTALRERKSYLLSLLDTVGVVISPSRFLKELFEAQEVSPRRFLYMRQGLDMSNWVDAEPTRSNSHLRIGYIGQIAKHKGVDVLVEAFHRLCVGEKKPHLLLYGDADQFPHFAKRLRKQVANRKDIVFAGQFEHSQIRRIHAGIDVLVVPSVWYENSPNVILEAFAAGTPVVVSAIGGMAELIEDGVNGFQFAPGDVESLACLLQRLADDPSLVQRLREGIPSVKAVEEEVAQLVQVYRLAIGGTYT